MASITDPTTNPIILPLIQILQTQLTGQLKS